MTKHFCDLCGAPAKEELKKEVSVPYGEPWTGYSDGAERTGQCRIAVYVNFCFREEKSGYGGPPDLCASCAALLIRKLLESYDH